MASTLLLYKVIGGALLIYDILIQHYFNRAMANARWLLATVTTNHKHSNVLAVACSICWLFCFVFLLGRGKTVAAHQW